uniref:Scavenger receptor class B n=1 Tax=Dendroctonus ponderosae TaxID=77166 RepID=J3JXY8_DENPD|nr:unknown [Dendroctonus ponderosae]
MVQIAEMFPKQCCRKCALFCGITISFIVLGILIITFRAAIYKCIISKIFVLQADSYTFDMWKTNPLPMTLKLFLFNWTNPGEVLNSSVKPHFQQMGPYTFDETKEKVNITWNDNNTVSFYHLKRWWFNQSKSNGSLNDAITSINPTSLSSSYGARNWSYFLKNGLSIFLSSIAPSLHVTHTAAQVLFEGYEDSLMNMANRMPTFIVGSSLPNFDKFGWFYTRNNSETYEGHFNMDVGLTGQLGKLYSWKFMQHTPYFRDKCGDISGSAGEFFPANLNKESLVNFFSPDLCRYMQLEYEKEVDVNGVLGYKYVAGDRLLDNGTKVPDNKCFCNDDCMPYGVLDVSACRYGTPAFVSLPHFFKADPYYGSIIDGMAPREDLHDFYMIFEPKTGMPLKVAARIQVNLLLQPVDGIRLFQNVPKVYIPVLWFEQIVTIPSEFTIFVSLLKNFESICIAAGIVCILCAVVLEAFCCSRACNKPILSREHALKEIVPLTEKAGFEA